MKKRVAIGLIVGVGLGAYLSLLRTQVPLSTVLKQPLDAFLGSPYQLNSGVLEVTENIDSVEEATRRLLKPFGVVRVIRFFPAVAPSETPNN